MIEKNNEFHGRYKKNGRYKKKFAGTLEDHFKCSSLLLHAYNHFIYFYIK